MQGQGNSSRVTIDQEASFVSVSFTREANATAYAVGDVVSSAAGQTTLNNLLLNCAKYSGGGGKIVGVRVVMNDKNKTPALRLHFFSANTGVVTSGDNLAHSELYADVSKKLFSIDLPAMTSPLGGTTDISRSELLGLNIPFKCDPSSKDLYVLVESLSAFTPASASSFTVTILIDKWQ